MTTTISAHNGVLDATTASASAPVVALVVWEPVSCSCGRVVALRLPSSVPGTVKVPCKICREWVAV